MHACCTHIVASKRSLPRVPLMLCRAWHCGLLKGNSQVGWELAHLNIVGLLDISCTGIWGNAQPLVELRLFDHFLKMQKQVKSTQICLRQHPSQSRCYSKSNTIAPNCRFFPPPATNEVQSQCCTWLAQSGRPRGMAKQSCTASTKRANVVAWSFSPADFQSSNNF